MFRSGSVGLSRLKWCSRSLRLASDATRASCSCQLHLPAAKPAARVACCVRSEHCASQLDAANWCSAREHLNSFQLIQVVAVFLVLHRNFAAWAVGGLLRESQQFSPIRSQTLMPSFFLCSRQCSTEPPSQPSRPAIRRGIFFREFRFPFFAVP